MLEQNGESGGFGCPFVTVALYLVTEAAAYESKESNRKGKSKMRLAGKASRSVVLLLISLMLAGAITPINVFGQSQQPALPPEIQSVLDRAEEAFHQGEQAQA